MINIIFKKYNKIYNINNFTIFGQLHMHASQEFTHIKMFYLTSFKESHGNSIFE